MTKKIRFFGESFAARGARMGWTHEVGECGRHAPRAARVLRAPGRCGEAVDLAVGGEDVAPCGVRPRHARPSRVAEGVGGVGFHVGTVPKRNPASPNQQRVGARSTRAALGAWRPTTEPRVGVGCRAGARNARPYQCRGPCAPGPTSGPVRTPRAEGGVDTSHARGAFMYGSYRNTKPKRLGNASVWC